MRRIVLVRPAVEAGERLGFLPGDLTQKVDPYLRPMYDALWEMIAFSVVFFAAFVYMVASGALEWGPVARQLRLEPSIGAAATGVRIVGLEGRPGQEVA